MLLCAVMMAAKTVLQNSSTIQVTVNLHQDARFEFPCAAQSDDSTPVSVRWYRVDEESGDEIAVRVIPRKLSLSDNGSLIIELAKNDTKGWGQFHGQYKCRASNSYSEAERLAYIQVNNYVPPGHCLHCTMYVVQNGQLQRMIDISRSRSPLPSP